MTISFKVPPNENDEVPEAESTCEKHSEDDIKDFTDLVGSDGPWQRWIFVLVVISGIPVAWNHMVISFFAYPADFWCINSQMNQSIGEWPQTPVSNDSLNACHLTLGKNESVRKIPQEVTCSQYKFDCPESHVSVIKQWNLVCDRSWMPSMSQSMYMAGFLASALFSGQMADIFGRHPIIMFNIVVLLVSGVTTAFSTSFIMFIISRVFVAMGQAGMNLTVFVLLVEVVGVKQRATYALTYAFGWHIGYCSLPLIAYFLPTWYELQLAITLPCIVFLSFFWILPESPRWLIAKGKYEKAIETLKKAAKMNKKNVPDLETHAKKLFRISETEKPPKATFFDLMRTPNLRKNTLILYFTWCIIAFVYYGMSLNIGDLGGNLYLNVFLSGFVEIPATVACVFILKRYGRKLPFIIMLILGGLTSFGCIFTPSIYWLHVTIAMMGKLFVSCSFSVVYVYSAEIYPTVARNVGVGTSSMIARFGTMISPFMKELSNKTGTYVPLTIFTLLSLVNAFLVWFLPETKGCPVPETIQDAEEFEMKEKPSDKEDNEKKPQEVPST